MNLWNRWYHTEDLLELYAAIGIIRLHMPVCLKIESVCTIDSPWFLQEDKFEA